MAVSVPTQSVWGAINSLTPEQFEHYVAEVFRRKGYEVKVTQHSGDFGADLIVTSEIARAAVQVKHYSEGNNVGVKDVTHLIGSKQFYNCESAIVVTTSSFTKAAREMAEKANVQLWDGQKLIALAKETGLYSEDPERQATVIYVSQPSDLANLPRIPKLGTTGKTAEKKEPSWGVAIAMLVLALIGWIFVLHLMAIECRPL